MRRYRSIAWLALWAMLFSSASPALAAVFARTPAASAQILGIPPAPASDAVAQHATHHADPESAPTHTPSGGSTHESHGVSCSFCLNPSSVATIAAAPAPFTVPTLAFDVATPVAPPQYDAPFLAHYRSRAPPRIS